jgi:O-antigen/teichoic acid export membrane protein
VFGLLFYALGAGVTGAFLGTAASVTTVAVVLLWPLREELARAVGAAAAPAHWVRDLIARTWAPATGLLLLFILQEIHVIVVKHQAPDDAAGSWAAAAVAAKAIIWVAIGLGLYLLPEAARRSRQGEDARPVLIRTLVLIALVATPMVLLYAVAAEPLLATVFGEEFTDAAGALPWLGLAMALLACAYLSVQYLLALGHSRFLWLLGVAALVEPLLVLGIGAHLTEVALALLAIQATLAACVIAVSMRSREAIGEPPPLPA